MVINDNFVNRVNLTGRSVVTEGSNIGATGEVGEPDHAGNSLPLESIWWSWTAPSSGKFSIFTLGSGLLDTILAVYTGSSVFNLVEVAANDDLGRDTSNFQSLVEVNAIAGTSYQIVVDGFAETGAIQLSISPSGITRSTFGGGSLNLGTNLGDLLRGSSLNDTVAAFAGDDAVFGIGGNDSIDGGFGNDSLYGGIGNDTLIGNIGNDTLVGGSDFNQEIDVLFGGAGSDYFVLNGEFGNYYLGDGEFGYALIRDFSSEDRIQILGGIPDLNDPEVSLPVSFITASFNGGNWLSIGGDLIAIVQGAAPTFVVI
jgi:serralysin